MTLIKQSQESLEMLVIVSRLLSSKLEISELLTTIMRLSSRVVGAERASLYLLDEKTQELYFDVALGLPKEVQKMRLKLGEGIAGACAKEGISLIHNDVSQDPRHTRKVDSQSGFVTRSLLTCPMVIKGKVIGVVQAINKIEGDFDETDRNNFEAFASQAAIAIENSRLFASVREEKRKLEIVFKKIKEGAVLTDMDGEILLMNSAAKLYLEHDKYKFTNIKSAFDKFKTDAEIEYKKMADSPNLINRFELEREKPKKLFLEVSAIKLMKSQNKEEVLQEGWLWILADITDQKMEEKLARNFLSLISHKFKTPLAAINGYAQIISNELKENSSKLTKKALSTIIAQGQKLTKLIESLLSFVTINNQEEGQINLSEFEIKALLEDCLSEAKQNALRKEKEIVNFKLMVPINFRINADYQMLKTAIRNLIENAIKFNPASEKLVIVSAQIKNQNAIISVGDNGPGIPPEELSNIFNKFYQVEDSFTGQVDGWGLGLSLVKRIAQMHGGDVFVKSQIQKGSAFSIKIPLK